MWWILLALVLLASWATWLTFNLNIVIPFTTSVLVVLSAAALLVFRRIRSSRAGEGLERAILDQGAQQAAVVQPERHREIEALQRQIQSGIRALKSSKMGKSRRSGSAALYALPWYVIIGPPGAGKTTALKHSSLVFSCVDPESGGGVRGVGGTRHCDFWFANEAILLDTAGRYATERGDHEEWMAFLAMLHRYRGRRPLDGILVVVSVAELIGASEQQVDETASRLRARIGEVMDRLEMTLPVYLLFTKCDRIAGFTQFFGDLRRSDRAQAWGATLPIDADRTRPGRRFDAEIDALMKQVHARMLRRLVTERSQEARERIYRFPLELSSVRQNLARLVDSVFAVNAYRGTPIFRGFYFTSGAQEDAPNGRERQAMAQHLGTPPHQGAPHPAAGSKGYFLHDIFTNIVFHDRHIAARSAGNVRRQRLMGLAISAAAAALGVVLVVPSAISFANNRRFLRETEDHARAVGSPRGGGQPLSEKLAAARGMLERLREMDRVRKEGTRSGVGLTMYQGETVYPALRRLYASFIERTFILPCKQRLEVRLERARGERYLRNRRALMMYLMLRDVDHLDVDWATEQLTALGAEEIGPLADMSDAELKEQLGRHVSHYLSLVKRQEIAAIPLRDELIERVREALRSVPAPQRYYSIFIDSLTEERYDLHHADPKYPAITLEDVFRWRAGALTVIGSQQHDRERRWKEVGGPYTEKGRSAVLNNIARSAELLEQEHWLVPPDHDEPMERTTAHLEDMANDYAENYKKQWTAWMQDIVIRPPASARDAIKSYAEIERTVSPYLLILRTLEDNTQWKQGDTVLDDQQWLKYLSAMLNDDRKRAAGGSRFKLKIDADKIGRSLLRIRDEFKGLVEFGVPSGASGAAPLIAPPLARYISLLGALREDIEALERADPATKPHNLRIKLIEARRQVDALLQPLDDRTRSLLQPLLLSPLDVAEAQPWRPAAAQ
ncbi:type VI secretion system membrane subunit TssM [Sorangium sp. So ce1036]|uniref:type VI secretion system membrane subunit TssM n=1 Tax=Sorangium sp. So ce1036 TaxID=3133328 RepID=UPI003F073A78